MSWITAGPFYMRFYINKVKKILARPEPAVPLLEAVDRARREWQESWRELDTAEGSLVDYVIYKMNAAERRYVSLLGQAKREGLKAWEEPLLVHCNGYPNAGD